MKVDPFIPFIDMCCKTLGCGKNLEENSRRRGRKGKVELEESEVCELLIKIDSH